MHIIYYKTIISTLFFYFNVRLDAVLALAVVLCSVVLVANDDSGPRLKSDLERFPIERSSPFFVPVTVFNKQEIFCIDTGATATILDKVRFSQLLGKVQKEEIASGAVNMQRISLFRSPAMIVGQKAPIETGGGKGLIGGADLSAIRKSVDVDISGILGMDFLRTKVLRIDPDAGYIEFPNCPTNASVQSERLVLLESGLPSVRLQVADAGFRSFIIDTGFNGSLTLETELFSKLLKAKKIALRSRGTMDEIGGEAKFRRGIISQVTLGPYVLSNLNVDETSHNSIGLLFLERFVTEIDFSNRKLFLTASQFMNLPELRTLCGFSVTRVNRTAVINDAEDSARDAGIQNEDVIITINKTPAHKLSLSKIRILCTVPDSQLNLTLERDGKRFDVTLDLKRIPDPFPSVVSEENAIPSEK